MYVGGVSMSLTHDQIQERIDRTINNHQMTCQTVGYNIYLLNGTMGDYTLPVDEWTADSVAYNKSYLIRDEALLETPELKNFIHLHKTRVHPITFNNNLLVIEDQL